MARGPESWKWAGALATALLALGAGARAEEAKPLCATALAAGELATVASGFEPMAEAEHAPGHSECSWMAPAEGGTATLLLTWWTPAAVREALIPADTPADYYQMLVGSAEDVAGTAGRPLAGAGQRSALFERDGVRTAYLLTAGGVAHLVAQGLSEAQFEAAVRAAATP